MMEIERKFLVKNDNWVHSANSTMRIQQGYLLQNDNSSMRVRVTNDRGYITYKKKFSHMASHEFEYEIPVADAYQLLVFCVKTISKERNIVTGGWEVDRFLGNNKGLVVAEFELYREDEEFDKPDWLGEEVTGQYKYYNINLINKPFKEW